MPTEPKTAFAQSDLAQPAYFAYRPYSHTDRRQVLTLSSGPFATRQALDVALNEDKSLHGCRLTPLGATNLVDIRLRDEEIYRALRKKQKKNNTKKITAEDLPFIAASWTPRASTRLKLESRRMALFYRATEWAELEQEAHEGKKRSLFVIELTHPATATTSPSR